MQDQNQTPEQRANIYRDAGVADPSAPITSDTLTPTASLNFNTPQQVPIDTSAYATLGDLNQQMQQTFQPTQPEQEATDLTTRVRALNDQLVGQSTYRTEQENKQGIPQLMQTQTDLTNRLRTLQNESLAIPLQIQQDATGRGITAGGIQPIQTAARRNNAIQSLSTSALLQASQGNLSTALNLVDRAVSQKFDPIKEEIAAKTANLNLILQSPANSLADKKRAQAQLDIQNKKAAVASRQTEDYKVAQAMAAAAVKLNPGNQAALLAAQQAQNLNPEDPNYLMKSFQLLGQFQSDPAQVQKDLDAHLQATAALESVQNDNKLAPLKKQELEEQIKGIQNDNALAPEKKQQLLAQIQSSRASAASAWASAAKTQLETQQLKNGTTSSKQQNALEQQYRQVLLKEVSNRSGGVGLQDAKVNQAIHLKALLDQYKDKNGNYNVPESQYAELAMGLAGLISGTNAVSESAREAIMQKTASGDFKGAITYITGTPQKGTTQAIIKNLADSIDRQGSVAEDLRDQGVKFLKGLAPTELDQSRLDALNKESLASYKNPNQGVTQSSDKYSQYRSQLQTGEILIRRGGQILAVTQKELKPGDEHL